MPGHVGEPDRPLYLVQPAEQTQPPRRLTDLPALLIRQAVCNELPGRAGFIEDAQGAVPGVGKLARSIDHGLQDRRQVERRCDSGPQVAQERKASSELAHLVPEPRKLLRTSGLSNGLH